MAYAASNPPTLNSQRVGGGGAIWTYLSTDVSTDVDAAGYFTNGDALGMKVGDVVLVIETDNSYLQTTHSVTAVTAGGAATVSAAT
jgi:lipid-binding SYLF domain-containing protein